MEYTDIRVGDALIHNADAKTRTFINQWVNDSDYIIAHTSGSTGKPKEIKLLKSDMIISAKSTCDFFKISHESNMVLPLSPDYIAGKMMIVRAIVSGSQLWIESPSNNPLVQDYGYIDLMPIVPSQIDAVIQSKYVSKINNLIIGGAAIPAGIEIKIPKHINAYATYGMTETCSHVALRKIGDTQNVYFALPDIEFNIDNRGCLTVNSNNRSFGSLQTNDVVDLIDTSKFKWIGRYDNVINTGGVKVFPEEIERKINNIIKQPFYIIGCDNNKWGSCVILYIEGENIMIDNIKKELTKILDKFSMPKEIRVVSSFEKTSSGKIKRVLL